VPTKSTTTERLKAMSAECRGETTSLQDQESRQTGHHHAGDAHLHTGEDHDHKDECDHEAEQACAGKGAVRNADND
jgi:hypothetical protein